MLEETRLWIQPGFLYHTDKAVKDFNILMALTIYDGAFPNLNVVTVSYTHLDVYKRQSRSS